VHHPVFEEPCWTFRYQVKVPNLEPKTVDLAGHRIRAGLRRVFRDDHRWIARPGKFPRDYVFAVQRNMILASRWMDVVDFEWD